MPLISVLITTYNREKFIRDAIQSVLKSSFQDFEIIIVDDCSLDSSYEIAREYARIDERIKVFINEKNLGDYSNRIKAASLAQGTYLKFVDADDKIYPWTLEAFVGATERFPTAALFISPTSERIIEEFPFILTPNESLRYHFFKAAILDGGPTCTLIKKSIYDDIGGFSNDKWISDFKLWLTIASTYDIVILNQGLIFWRQHTGQQINEERANQKEFEILFELFFKSFIIETNNECLNMEEKKIIFKNYFKSNFKKLLEKISKWIFNLSSKF